MSRWFYIRASDKKEELIDNLAYYGIIRIAFATTIAFIISKESFAKVML